MLNVNKVYSTEWTTLEKVRDFVAKTIEGTQGITAQGVLAALSTAKMSDVAVSAPFADFQTNNGVIIPDMSSAMEVVTEAYKVSLGNDIDTTSETHVGRMIEQTARLFSSSLGIIAYNIMQHNVDTATGEYLDSLASMFLIERRTDKASEVSVTVSLTSPAATRADDIVYRAGSMSLKDDNGNKFVLTEDAVFAGGSTPVNSIVCKFVCDTVGPVIPSLVAVEYTKPDGVTCEATGSYDVGYTTETDGDLRDRINKMRAKSTHFMESVKSEVMSVYGVSDVMVIENTNDSIGDVSTRQKFPDTNGVPMPGHSICVIVDYDGTQETANGIAKAIFNTKSVGCGYATNSNAAVTNLTGMTEVTITVTDEYFGNKYPVTFHRPVLVPILVQIDVARHNYSGETLVADVKKAIISWVNGDVPYVDGLTIGQSVKAFELGAAVSDQIPSIQINSVVVKKQADTSYSTIVNLVVYQRASIADDNITVTVDGV